MMVRTQVEAYLDIETTGLSSSYADITVIGIYLVNGSGYSLVQLVGEEITGDTLLEALKDVDTIHTYNGKRFDLPFINASLGIDLHEYYCHHDLMYDCWRNNLYGGLKVVEQQLGIPRDLKGVGGLEAVMLWWRYKRNDDEDALKSLLAYNREDVVNLKVLRERLSLLASKGP